VKVHIIGGPGSGKTTLATGLAQHLHIPLHELDQLVWKHGSHLKPYITAAFELAARPDWVSEGAFLVWIDPLLAAADLVIYIDVPWQVACWRVLRRHIKKTLRGVNPYKTSQLWDFLIWSYSYYTDKIDADREQYPRMRAYLAEREAGSAPPPPETLLRQFEIYEKSFPLSAAFTRASLEKYRDKLFIYRGPRDHNALLSRLVNFQGILPL
jgi:adenylate kinase family enzyme